MEALFGAKYAGFILAAWGVSALAVLALIAWVWLGHRARRAELARLEKAGLRRAASHP